MRFYNITLSTRDEYHEYITTIRYIFPLTQTVNQIVQTYTDL